MENTTQEEILEETEQEGLVEAPEQEENEQSEEVLAEKSKAKVKEDDDEDDEKEDDDDEEEEDEQVKKEEVKVPSTKSAMIKALFDKVNGLKKEEVSAKWKDLWMLQKQKILEEHHQKMQDPMMILIQKKMKLVKRKRKLKFPCLKSMLKKILKHW